VLNRKGAKGAKEGQNCIERPAHDARSSEHIAGGDKRRHGCKPVWNAAANRRVVEGRAQDAWASEHLAEGDKRRHGCKPVWNAAANRRSSKDVRRMPGLPSTSPKATREGTGVSPCGIAPRTEGRRTTCAGCLGFRAHRRMGGKNAQDAVASEHLAGGDRKRHGCKPVWNGTANRRSSNDVRRMPGLPSTSPEATGKGTGVSKPVWNGAANRRVVEGRAQDTVATQHLAGWAVSVVIGRRRPAGEGRGG